MSYSDQFAQDRAVVPDTAETSSSEESKIFNAVDLERLIPQNISSNKRAVIERLVSLYQLNERR